MVSKQPRNCWYVIPYHFHLLLWLQQCIGVTVVNLTALIWLTDSGEFSNRQIKRLSRAAKLWRVTNFENGISKSTAWWFRWTCWCVQKRQNNCHQNDYWSHDIGPRKCFCNFVPCWEAYSAPSRLLSWILGREDVARKEGKHRWKGTKGGGGRERGGRNTERELCPLSDLWTLTKPVRTSVVTRLNRRHVIEIGIG